MPPQEQQTSAQEKREGLNERALVRRILDGDEQAFNAFYEAHKKRLERTAIHFLGAGHPSIPDVLQDTFLNAIPKLPEFRYESTLFTWLNHFVVNFCFQVLKKGKKTLPVETEWLEETAGLRGTSGEMADSKAWSGALAEEIKGLDPEQRQILTLREIEGKSYGEIGREMKLAPGTVMSRLSRARQELRQRLVKKKALFGLFWK